MISHRYGLVAGHMGITPTHVHSPSNPSSNSYLSESRSMR